jgi:hypothetical protein
MIKLYPIVVAIFMDMVLPNLLFTEASEEPKITREKSWGISPLPILAFTPETGFMFGAAAFFYYYPAPYSPEQKPNIINLMMDYTTKKQFEVGISTGWYFRGDKFKLLADLGFSRFPDQFWGIRPDTPSDLEENYTPLEFTFTGSFLRRFYRHLYIGPRVHYLNSTIVKTEEGSLLAQRDIPGSDETAIFGVGAGLVWDSRDHVYFPLSGSLLGFNTTIYRKALGSDKNYIALQGEYRYPIIWRFEGVVFGAIGQVAPALD